MATSEVEGFPDNFTPDKAKAALQEILAALTGGEVVEALESARETAGNDMVALMTRVFPLVTQVTTKVISNYGFTQDGVGAENNCPATQHCQGIFVAKKISKHRFHATS
ncbi:hypothetical protein O3P69_007188 [Scylla paramamosain]|uniref:Protein C10 n=1 Tax=Scylla paramamosain TaxID=85552 RepID=A0AAW0V607_SCYPA